jgi:hypothetical protein
MLANYFVWLHRIVGFDFDYSQNETKSGSDFLNCNWVQNQIWNPNPVQELELELELKKLFGGEKWYGTGGKLASNCWFQTRLPKTKYDFHNQNQICNPS